jgi:hypothetical protein
LLYATKLRPSGEETLVKAFKCRHFPEKVRYEGFEASLHLLIDHASRHLSLFNVAQ